MANLKQKILQSLKSTKQVKTTLNTIAMSQENLLKNYSNPVFNQKDRGKLLKSYTDLQDIGKSLYRYNTLQEHNYLSDAEEEKGNIESKVMLRLLNMIMKILLQKQARMKNLVIVGIK